jgi:hypothetical protein
VQVYVCRKNFPAWRRLAALASPYPPSLTKVEIKRASLKSMAILVDSFDWTFRIV